MHHLLLFLPLLALGLFFVLPWQLALALYVPIAIGSLVAYRKAWQAQSRPQVTGKRAMIGDQAEVAGTDGDGAEVEYQGALWRAVSSQPLHPGQQVIIEAVDGLTLRVAPLSRPGGGGRSR